MNRREFFQLAGSAAVVGTFPDIAWAKAQAPQHPSSKRILVLVELKGGNDGFNTLVPYDDDDYYHLRPKIGIKKAKVVPLQDGMGMHVSLKPLKSIWDSGDMAWIQGVGYPHSVLSHFRSMDIWDTGVLQANSSNGWLTRIVPRFHKGVHGIVVTRDQDAMGPLGGSQLNSISMENPASFIAQSKLIHDVNVNRRTAALAHLTETQHQLAQAGNDISQKLRRPRPVYMRNHKGVLGHSLKSVAEMIINDVNCPVYKVTQDGFDTHVNQPGMQSNALYHVGTNLASFAETLKRAGKWENVLVVTYSEFGRRIKENKGQGTDHGTASANLVMGGQVRRGIYGRHPSLNPQRLDANDNVAHTTDFRSIYATLAQRWWRQPNLWQGHNPIPFV